MTGRRPAFRARRGIGVVLIATILIAGLRWHRQSREADFRRECRYAFETEDWATLGEASAQWQAFNPASEDALLYLAEFRARSGDMAAAVDLLTSLPDESDKTVAALMTAVDIQFQELQRPLDGLNTLDRLIRLAPEVSGFRRRQLFFYAMTLQRTKLIAAIRSSIEDRAEPPEAYVYLVLAGNLSFTNGVGVTQRWLSASPEETTFQIAFQIQKADFLSLMDAPTEQSRRELESTWKSLDRLLEQNPTNPILVRHRLFRAAADDDSSEVGRLLSQLPDEAWDDSVFLRYRAWFSHRQGQLDEAEESYRRSLQVFPMDWQTWQGLAEVLRRKGSFDRAEEAQKIALEGKELRKTLVQQPDAAEIQLEHLARIEEFARHCGDRTVSKAISKRLAEQYYTPIQETASASG